MEQFDRPNVFKRFHLTKVETLLSRLGRMCWLRTLLACLLMALVPLQSWSAAAKVCCMVRGHAVPALQSGPDAAHMARTGQQLVRHPTPQGIEARTLGLAVAECAVCAASCHSAAIPCATRPGPLPVLVDHPPGRSEATPVSAVIALPDKPPRA